MIRGAGGNFCSGGDVHEIIGPLTKMDARRAARVHPHDRRPGAGDARLPAADHRRGRGRVRRRRRDHGDGQRHPLRPARLQDRLPVHAASACRGADMGACAILPRIIGHGRAAELLFTGRSMTSDEGLAWGFYNRVVEDVLAEAYALADELAQRPEHRPRGDQAAARRRVARAIEDALEMEARGAGAVHGDQRLQARLRSLRGQAERRSSRVTDGDRASSPGRSSSRATASWPSELAALVRGDNPRRPHGDDLDAECRALVRELGSAGFLKLCVADGEHRPDVRSLAIARETLAYHQRRSPISPSPCRGSARARSRCSARSSRSANGCRKVASGEAIAAFAMTEPECGSDAANMATSAMRDGNEWVLVGEKTYISNGGIADFYVTFARTGEGEGARGLSAFIVPADAVDSRRADRGHRAAPARAAEVRQCPHPRRRDHRRAGRGLPHRHGDAEPVPGDGRRGGARLRAARARRGAELRERPPARQRHARRQCGDAGEARRHGAGDRCVGAADLPRRLAAGCRRHRQPPRRGDGQAPRDREPRSR